MEIFVKTNLYVSHKCTLKTHFLANIDELIQRGFINGLHKNRNSIN